MMAHRSFAVDHNDDGKYNLLCKASVTIKLPTLSRHNSLSIRNILTKAAEMFLAG